MCNNSPAELGSAENEWRSSELLIQGNWCIIQRKYTSVCRLAWSLIRRLIVRLTGLDFSADLRCSSNYWRTQPLAMKWAMVSDESHAYRSESVLIGQRKLYHAQSYLSTAQPRKGMWLRFHNFASFTYERRRDQMTFEDSSCIHQRWFLQCLTAGRGSWIEFSSRPTLTCGGR